MDPQHSYSLRSKDRQAPTSSTSSVPNDYVSLEEFNKTTNKYGLYSGLSGQPVNEANIYVKIVDLGGKVGARPFLWWKTPLAQIDDFVYTGSSKDDINLCNLSSKAREYTWHHTGWPQDSHREQRGAMQLVPTAEHIALQHYGGAWFAYKENAG